jgi:hypothetical protein
MQIRAYCWQCEEPMIVHPVNLTEVEFWAAINGDQDVEVMDDKDHRWKLNKREKENLRDTRAKGISL